MHNQQPGLSHNLRNILRSTGLLSLALGKQQMHYMGHGKSVELAKSLHAALRSRRHRSISQRRHHQLRSSQHSVIASERGIPKESTPPTKRPLLPNATAILASARSDDAPVVKASSASSASITLDGLLNESVWRDAPVMRLTQQAPKPGQPAPYQTQVRVLVTSDLLYFGFELIGPKRTQIVFGGAV